MYDFTAELEKASGLGWTLGLDFADWAIETADKWRGGEIPSTPKDFVMGLGESLAEVCEKMGVPEEKATRHRKFFYEKNQNPATATLISLVKADHSEFFAQYMQGAVTAQAFTMEIAYGWCEDLNGVMREVPETDPVHIQPDDDGNRYIRWRDERAADLMRGFGECAKFICIAQGTMPEIRHFPYPLDLLQRQTFVCYDPATIDLQQFFRVNIKGFIQQHQMDIGAALQQEIANLKAGQRPADMISIKGYLSYAVPALPRIIPAAASLLERGGVIGADFQLDSKIMNRNKRLFMWGSEEGMQFDLMKSPEDVEWRLSNIIKDEHLPLKLKVEPSPEEDTIGVYVTMTKV